MNSIRFLELLTKLRATDASFARIKVLSEMWRFVSGLSADERVELIRELGLEGQERVFERFLSCPGTRSAEIIQLADDVLQRVDVEKLEMSAQQRLSEDSFDQRSDQSAHEIGNLTATIPPTPPDVLPSARSYSDRFSDTDISRLGRAEEEETSVDRPAPPDAEPGETFDQEVLRSTPTPAVDPPPSQLDESAATPPPLEPTALETASAGSETSVDPKYESLDEGGEQAIASVTPVDEGSTIDELIHQLAEIDSPSARFRSVMKRGNRLNAITCQEAGELLGLFAAGWMQRRVLMMFLRNGVSGGVDELLKLIGQSATRPSDYLWYAGQLIHGQSISESEKALLLEKAPTRTIKRKISNWSQRASIRINH